MLQRLINLMEELHVPSSDACASDHYSFLGLTDAAIGTAAKRQRCSVITNDANLYAALSSTGISTAKFDHLRAML